MMIYFALFQLVLFFCFALAFVESDADAYKWITTLNAFVGFAIALSIMLYNFCRPYEDTSTFEQMVFKKVNEYLNQINESYKEQNLEWVLIPNHYWMELRMLDKNENDYDEPEDAVNESRGGSDDENSQLFDDEED
jgi:hypothetical protein